MNNLTDLRCRRAAPRDRTYRLSDGKGLYLEVTPQGGKRWRFRYRRPVTGKENLLSLGLYPDVSLKRARERRDEVRGLLAEGVDPAEARREEKRRRAQAAANTFRAVAEDWYQRRRPGWSDSHAERVWSRVQRLIIPYIGDRPVSEIAPPEVLDVVRRVERCSLDTAHRCQQYMSQIFRYAISTGLTVMDPVASIKGALPPLRQQHMAAPTVPEKVGEILRMLDSFQGTPVVAAAIRLLPLVFVRPGELRKARWSDMDLEAAEWRYTTSKTGTDHLVPLSRQAVAILEELRPLTGHLPGGWVFPGGRSPMRPMSDMAINAAYRRLGIDTRSELTGHGWRAVARTLLHERLGYPPEVIEHQLAHRVPDALGRAYNRTRFLEQRRKMMQEWADYLDKLKAGAEIVPIDHKSAGC